ncbi:MAG: hypothetical protein AB7P04_02660 [Bacteriovoracia bacterium]
MSAEKPGICWNCSQSLTALDYGRQDTCRKCGRDTRVCKNCEFYDKAYNNECRETQAERVVEKERGNFCDYFTPSSRAGGNASRDAARAAAEALFKKKT